MARPLSKVHTAWPNACSRVERRVRSAMVRSFCALLSRVFQRLNAGGEFGIGNAAGAGRDGVLGQHQVGLARVVLFVRRLCCCLGSAGHGNDGCPRHQRQFPHFHARQSLLKNLALLARALTRARGVTAAMTGSMTDVMTPFADAARKTELPREKRICGLVKLLQECRPNCNHSAILSGAKTGRIQRMRPANAVTGRASPPGRRLERKHPRRPSAGKQQGRQPPGGLAIEDPQ